VTVFAGECGILDASQPNILGAGNTEEMLGAV